MADLAAARKELRDALCAVPSWQELLVEACGICEGTPNCAGDHEPCGCHETLRVIEAALNLLAATEPAPALPDEVKEAAEMLRLTLGMRETKHACTDRACSNVALGALNLLAALGGAR